MRNKAYIIAQIREVVGNVPPRLSDEDLKTLESIQSKDLEKMTVINLLKLKQSIVDMQPVPEPEPEPVPVEETNDDVSFIKRMGAYY